MSASACRLKLEVCQGLKGVEILMHLNSLIVRNDANLSDLSDVVLDEFQKV